MAFHTPNQYRLREGTYASDNTYGNNGAFVIPCASFDLLVIASDGGGWEHVSVSLRNRCPSWPEMCYIKSLFWDEEDCVVQYHPPKSKYVNFHPHCLHLWRPIGQTIPTPPEWMVGFPSNA